MKEEDERGGKEKCWTSWAQREKQRWTPLCRVAIRQRKSTTWNIRGRTGKINGSNLFKVARRETRISFGKGRKGEDIQQLVLDLDSILNAETHWDQENKTQVSLWAFWELDDLSVGSWVESKKKNMFSMSVSYETVVETRNTSGGRWPPRSTDRSKQWSTYTPLH